MFEYNTVEEAVKDLQDGKLILVSDDESRENEGDLICAAEFATTENVNFMATYGKGLIVEIYAESWDLHRWLLTILITMKLHLQCQ